MNLSLFDRLLGSAILVLLVACAGEVLLWLTENPEPITPMDPLVLHVRSYEMGADTLWWVDDAGVHHLKLVREDPAAPANNRPQLREVHALCQ